MSTWGIIPAAGRGTRIQPLAFSKELLPVGSRISEGTERPCAVSEYLLDRMLLAGADRICFVISAAKYDIMQYFGAEYGAVPIAYVLQPRPAGLCDAIFQAEPVVRADDNVLVGLPDTIWYPEGALGDLPEDQLAFLLFPVERPEFFDSVVLDTSCRVVEIQVKDQCARSNWIWGAFRMPGHIYAELRRLWLARGCRDEYFGTLVNAYLEDGGSAVGFKTGRAYVDVGTLNGYRAASALIAEQASPPEVAPSVRPLRQPFVPARAMAPQSGEAAR